MIWALFDDGCPLLARAQDDKWHLGEAPRRPEVFVTTEDGNLAHWTSPRTGKGLFCLSPLASTPSDTRPLVFQSNTNSRRSPGSGTVASSYISLSPRPAEMPRRFDKMLSTSANQAYLVKVPTANLILFDVWVILLRSLVRVDATTVVSSTTVPN